MAKKGLGELMQAVLLFMIVVLAVVLVLTIARPTVDRGVLSIDIKNAGDIMLSVDNALREVVSEGFNSSRLVTFTAPKTFESLPEEDAIQFKTIVDAEVSGAGYLTRTSRNNLIFIGGSDVSCEEKDGNSDNVTDIVIENSFVRGVFTLTRKLSPHQALDTSSNIVRIVEKSRNTSIDFVNSSIIINGNASSINGTGFSELSINGTNLPHCQAHFFVNATNDYDVYYKLYAGADFFVAEVRNIR